MRIDKAGAGPGTEKVKLNVRGADLETMVGPPLFIRYRYPMLNNALSMTSACRDSRPSDA